MMWYPEAWKSSPKVTAMPAAARAGYFDLLCAVWLNGASLPNDDAMLRACSRLTPSEWKRHRMSILAMFTVEDGEIKNERLTREYDKTIEKIEKRKAAADARWRNKQKQSTSNANALQMESNADAPRTRTRTRDIEESDDSSNPSSNDDGGSFETWYETYPRKVGKVPGRKAFHAVIVKGRLPAGAVAEDMDGLKGPDARFDRLMDTSAAWAADFERRDPDKRPHPATFINSLNWIKEPEAAKAGGMDGRSKQDQLRDESRANIAAALTARAANRASAGRLPGDLPDLRGGAEPAEDKPLLRLVGGSGPR